MYMKNPFRAGAGHQPPYLAGREDEKKIFTKLLNQDVITDNLVLTGLRGVGKTVLTESFKPIASEGNWLWVGTDLSESSSISEENIAIRLIADLSIYTSQITINTQVVKSIGFIADDKQLSQSLSYEMLLKIYQNTAGLIADKLKAVMLLVWSVIKDSKKGIIFAYDEAQNLSDHKQNHQFPLSLLLDVFQSLQRQGVMFLLVLTGLPTLFTKLVEARTYAERMFYVMQLDRLSDDEVRQAVINPIKGIELHDDVLNEIVRISGGYPYFVQFICKEVFDSYVIGLNQSAINHIDSQVIIMKLDTAFFAGRWGKITDRQKDLLFVIAHFDTDEFTVSQIVGNDLGKNFSSSHVNQLLNHLIEFGLVYKNRYASYSLAVPLLSQFILRQF